MLVEKSFAMDFKSAKRMIALAREHHSLIIENFLFPQHAQFQWIEQKMKEKLLGETRLLRLTFCYPKRSEVDIRYQKELGGGSLLDAGTYCVKAAQLLGGDDIQLVDSSVYINPEKSVDLWGSALFRTKEVMIQIFFGMDCQYQCTCEILGTEGRLTAPRFFTPAPDHAPVILIESKRGQEWIKLEKDDYYLNMCRLFVESVQNGDFSSHWQSVPNQARHLYEVQSRGLRQ